MGGPLTREEATATIYVENFQKEHKQTNSATGVVQLAGKVADDHTSMFTTFCRSPY